MDGEKDVSSMYVGKNISAKFWLSIMNGDHCGARLGKTHGFDLLSDVSFERHTITIKIINGSTCGEWIIMMSKRRSSPLSEFRLSNFIYITNKSTVSCRTYFYSYQLCST